MAPIAAITNEHHVIIFETSEKRNGFSPALILSTLLMCFTFSLFKSKNSVKTDKNTIIYLMQ